MSTLKTKLFDPAEHLDTPEAIAAYVTEAFQTDDPSFVADALGVIARARGISEVASRAGVTRERLLRLLSPNENPKLSTVMFLEPVRNLT